MPATTSINIQIPHDAIREFCEKWDIVKLEVFGSAIRDDFNPETSDIDLLLSKGTNTTVRISLFDEVTMVDELTSIFRRNVDLLWRSSIEKHYNEIRRKSILEHTETIYVVP